MAEKTPFEDLMRRAVDANVRYWETVGRAYTDAAQEATKFWRDVPSALTPSSRARDSSGESRTVPALLLEGPAGSEARAVVMVSNDLGRDAEAPVVPTPLTGPDGDPVGVPLRPDPDTVKVAPGERVPVVLSVQVTEAFVEGAAYRAELNVPGLSPHGVPVVVRRREASA